MASPTPAQRVTAALLGNQEFNDLVANLKSQRDNLTAVTNNVANLQLNLTNEQGNVLMFQQLAASAEQAVAAACVTITEAALAESL